MKSLFKNSFFSGMSGMKPAFLGVSGMKWHGVSQFSLKRIVFMPLMPLMPLGI